MAPTGEGIRAKQSVLLEVRRDVAYLTIVLSFPGLEAIIPKSTWSYQNLDCDEIREE